MSNSVEEKSVSSLIQDFMREMSKRGIACTVTTQTCEFTDCAVYKNQNPDKLLATELSFLFSASMPNIDGAILSILDYCRKNDVSLENSVFMKPFTVGSNTASLN